MLFEELQMGVTGSSDVPFLDIVPCEIDQRLMNTRPQPCLDARIWADEWLYCRSSSQQQEKERGVGQTVQRISVFWRFSCDR